MRLEGRSISVTEDLVLPAQPASGVTNYIPLGGDGYTAPFAAYAVNAFTLTGDATGGRVELKVTMDARYCSLVQYLNMTNLQAATADAEFRFVLGAALAAGAVPQQTLSGDITAINGNISGGVATLNQTWSPAPFILPGGDVLPFVMGQMLNVDTDVYTIRTYVFLFNIRVREVTPMGPLLWARGST